MSMFSLQSQWSEIESSVRHMDRAEVMRRFGTPAAERHFNGIDRLRFDFGDIKCSRLNVELEGRRVRRCWVDVVLPDPQNTVVLITPGVAGPVLASKATGLQAVALTPGTRVLQPLRLPDRGCWIIRTADAIDAPRWFLDLGDREQISQQLYRGKFVQIVDGPFRDSREALGSWPTPPRQPQPQPQPDPQPSSEGDA